MLHRLNFLRLMEKECSKEGKHYYLPFPLRVINTLSTNGGTFEKKLKNLKKRFIRGKQYHEDYHRFMEDMIKKVYPEKCVKQVKQGKTWFIPQSVCTSC